MMIRVQLQDFDIATEIEALRKGDTGIGGICSFVGTVRDVVPDASGGAAGDAAVSTMTLEHYPGMTEKALAEIETEANGRWPLSGVVIIHRYGELKPGDNIVLVITAAAHRQAAFEACQFLMDWLKTKAPFWKLESGDNGTAWVEAKSSDDDATARWR